MKQRHRRVHRVMWVGLTVFLVVAIATLLANRQSLTPGEGYARPAIFETSGDGS